MIIIKLSLRLTLTLTPTLTLTITLTLIPTLNLTLIPILTLTLNPNQIKFKLKFKVRQWRNEDGGWIGAEVPKRSFSRGDISGHQCPENVDLEIKSFSYC